MRIAICDDDLHFANLLQNQILEYMQENHSITECKIYSSGEELLEDDVSVFKLIFLDVNMAKLNGLETAKVLRKRNPDFILVFVSGLIEYAPSGFEVEAFRYLLKNRLTSSFRPCMDAVMKKLAPRKSITAEFIQGTRKVCVDEIVYVESNKHKLQYHLKDKNNNQDHYLYGKLDDVEKQLEEESFLRIHQSFLVNMAYIEKIANYEALLVSGAKLPISQKRFKNVKQAFVFYKVEKE